MEAGREFVAAYVEFVHYVERLYLAATRAAGHHSEPEAAEHEEPSRRGEVQAAH